MPALTFSVQDHVQVLTLKGLKVSLYLTTKKTAQGQKNNARSTVSNVVPTLFY